MPVRNIRMDDQLIELTQSVTVTAVSLFRRPENTITFIGVVDYTRANPHATNTLNFTQDAIPNLKFLDVSNTLVLADTLEANKLFEAFLTDTLTLNQTEFHTGPVVGRANNVLNLTDTTRQLAQNASASNTLNLTQSLDAAKPKNVEVETFTLGLVQTVVAKKVLNVAQTSFLSLGQSAARVLPQTPSNHVQLSHLAEVVLSEGVVSVVQLTHTVLVDNVNFALNELNLTQILESTGIVARTLLSNLSLSDIVTFYRVGNICDYDPGVGIGPPAPSMTPPVLTRRSTIVLTYPYPSATQTIELRAPVFDDTEQYEFRKINRKTRGGTLTIFRDLAWPTSERLIYSFDNLKDEKKQELLEFLQNSIGQEVGLLDYESRQWRGVILTPTTQAGHEDRAGFSITIEFEGVIDPGGLDASLIGSGSVVADATDIPPGFQVDISANLQLAGNVIRD